MKKSTLALAVAVGVLAQQAGAAGFIEDSKATLGLRNFYINTDNRDGTANPSKQEEWGQGFIFNFTSGYTQGTVGFGVDAIGLLGVKLDSGKGTAYNAGSANKGGTVFPSDSDGRAVDDFGSLGLTAKAKISKTELRLGTLQPKLPVVTSNDGRLLPQTFEGGQIMSNDIDNLTLVGGKLEHAKGRNSTNNDSLTIAGSNGATTTATSNKRSNEFYYAGGDYKITKDLVAQYYYGNLEDFYTQHFLGLTHNLALPVGSLKSDLRYFNSDSDGKNSSQEGRLAGYRSSGFQNSGEVDNRTWSAKFTYSLQGHALSAGYQRVNGTSDFPFLNQGDGASAYLITDSQIGKFQRAGERTWLAQYAYDFATVGLPGLTTSVIYLKGDNVATSTGDKGEWERDFSLGYVVQQGTFKGLGLAWKNATLRSDVASQRNQDENRLIVSYSIPLL
ncbi:MULTISPECIES: OprD family porin [Pseudomonas]|uniref:OprD family porin n=1 Tax=Pseudomonas lini TaxID=163011 RepID=A0A0J6H9C9_9PSED|nr:MULTISPECIES: OprD family porin [Pseudomonas]KAB0504278.1 OprD family porin [Pseudomonas lini]KMM90944.1 porin [Pseudomonas lini]KNH45448.1 porin [Pseudomonas lini]MDT9676209.1 OprD family porin [Pseudomonas sp. JV414]NSX07715.1 OprD family porin [Pseudomonas lini]